MGRNSIVAGNAPTLAVNFSLARPFLHQDISSTFCAPFRGRGRLHTRLSADVADFLRVLAQVAVLGPTIFEDQMTDVRVDLIPVELGLATSTALALGFSISWRWSQGENLIAR